MEIDILYIFVGALFVFAGAFFLGKWSDPTWRTKQTRQTMKKNAYMLGIISTDRKTITKVTVVPNGQLIEVNGNNWIIDPTRIYREDKPETGLMVKKKLMKYEEGVPTLYVYEDSLKPADFNPEPSKVSPGETGTGIEAYLAVERAKIAAGVIALLKKYELYLLLAAVFAFLAVIAAGVVYWHLDQVTGPITGQSASCDSDIQLVMNHFGVVRPIPGVNNTNGTIVING